MSRVHFRLNSLIHLSPCINSRPWFFSPSYSHSSRMAARRLPVCAAPFRVTRVIAVPTVPTFVLISGRPCIVPRTLPYAATAISPAIAVQPLARAAKVAVIRCSGHAFASLPASPPMYALLGSVIAPRTFLQKAIALMLHRVACLDCRLLETGRTRRIIQRSICGCVAVRSRRWPQ